jgi:hypothetical protein
MYFGTNLESTDSYRYAGQTVTLSYYARAGANYSPTSSALSAVVLTGTGTDQSFVTGLTGSTNAGSGAATLTTSWQRFTVTATISSSATQIAVYYTMTPTGTAGAADYFEITGVQLELGTATTFARTGGTIQGELAACQRYYYRATTAQAFGQLLIGGIGTSGTNIDYSFLAPVTLRTAATSIDYSTVEVFDGTNRGTITSATLNGNQSTPSIVHVSATIASGGVQYRPYVLRSNNSTSAYFGFSAEL